MDSTNIPNMPNISMPSPSSMEPKTIIMFVVIFILVYIIYYYFIQQKNMLMSGTTSGTQVTVIPAPTDTSTNFTYSIWFNINDWNYNYGKPKILFSRGDSSATPLQAVCPEVSFDGMQNNLTIKMQVSDSTTSTNTTGVQQTFTIPNIPIQRWTHLLISVYGRSLDTYLDGKMVSTSILSNVALIDRTLPLYVSPGGGFNGWTRQFQYWANATDPQTAWNIYQQGDGSNIFSNIFGNYGLQVSLLNGGTVQNTITI